MDEKYNEKEISVLSSREAVRLRPEKYFEKYFEEGSLDDLILEICCHAIDEVIDGNCNRLEFKVNKNELELKYNAGMSLELIGDKTKAELIMSSLFACKNEKKHKSVGDEFCELGMATINYVCQYCELETVKDGQSGKFIFEEGLLKDKKIQSVKDRMESFTRIIIRTDKKIFGELIFSYEGLRNKRDLLLSRFKGIEIRI